MKVLEINNNLAKISYDVKENLILSGFLIIEDANMPYVGQIISLAAEQESNYALVKLLFVFDEDGMLKDYNGSIPSLKSAVSKLDSRELLDIIPVETPIVFGELAQQKIALRLDKAVFEDNLVICSNKYENTDFLIQNFVKQFERLGQKTVIFDTDGEFSHPGMLIFGEDFKLPLNYETIDFIYENDLEDIDAVSKALIQEIFIELQEFVKAAPEKFIPFDTFLGIIEQQYKETNIIELLLLKNKLLKYKNIGAFAQDISEIRALNSGLEAANAVVIDISRAEPRLQREIIFHTYDIMENMGCEFYSFVKINNDNSSKKLLKRFIDKANISTISICTHEYKYLSELKQYSGSMILFMPLTSRHDFADYNVFLNKLNLDEFIVYGTYTQNIPFIVRIEDVDNLDSELPEELDGGLGEELSEELGEEFDEEPALVIDELPAEVNPSLEIEEPDMEPADEIIIEPAEDAEEIEIPEEALTVNELTDEPEEFTEEETLNLDILNDEEPDDENIIIEDESLVEEIQSVPVYPADDIDRRNAKMFEAGDSVSHAKYGHGVVEKIIKYGSKTLISINFEEAGKRLLDPAISEIRAEA
jgi:hypothetical protein